MNTLVSFNLAKILKQKGYTEVCFGCYDEKGIYGITPYRNFIEDTYNIAAPDIMSILLWIYNKYNIWITVTPELFNKTDIRFYPSYYENGIGENIKEYYNSPIQAYESVITYILTDIL